MALCYSRLLATILFVGVGVGLVAYIAMYVIVGDGGKTRIMTWLRNGTPLDEVDMMSTRPVAWTNHSQPAGGAVLITSLIRQTTNVTTTRHSEPHTGLGAQNATRHTGPRAEHEAGANTSRDNLDVTNDVFLGRFARICENVAIPKDIELNGRPLCPCIPQRLHGHNTPGLDAPSWQELEASHPDVQNGGIWKPASCVVRQRACLLLPYRDRDLHLRMWMHYMLPFMKKQNLDFHIYVAEQNSGSRFNRGMMINLAYHYAVKDNIHCDCAIIHDVDHVPEDDRNMYFCQDFPLHLAVARNVDHYRLPYHSFMGAAAALPARQFEKINGFSNLYFGWGSEDDDLFERFTKAGRLPVRRYPENIGRYFMFPHQTRPENAGRWKLVQDWKSRWNSDGLNSVMTNCDVTKVERRKLFTLIYAKVNETKVMAGTRF